MIKGGRQEMRRMPLWPIVLLALLFSDATVSCGVKLGRDLATSRTELAAAINGFTRSTLIAALVTLSLSASG